MSSSEPSPIVGIYAALRPLAASWRVEVGRPAGPGWVQGADLRDASAGPFNDLLRRIGVRADTADRRTIAASFAVRYGWASAMAIAPYVRYGCVPDIALENVAFKFRESTFLECTAIHEARGFMIATAPGAQHPTILAVEDQHALLKFLRVALVDQASPVVESLYAWAGFSRRGTWGMLTSSWVAHFTGLFDGKDQRELLPTLGQFFGGDDIVALMQPRMHAVTCRGVTHLYQRRASCCRWYLLPQGELCTSCPLVSQEERVERNLAWMERQMGQQTERKRHA